MLGLRDSAVPFLKLLTLNLQLTPYLWAMLACAKVSETRRTAQFPAALLYLPATAETLLARSISHISLLPSCNDSPCCPWI